jgi:hypothetical protein
MTYLTIALAVASLSLGLRRLGVSALYVRLWRPRAARPT